jgi:hypothetical protein
MIPEMRNQIRRLGKCAAAGNVNIVTQNTPRFFLLILGSGEPLSKLLRGDGEEGFKCAAAHWPIARRAGKSAAMDQRSKFTQAAGSILAISIIAGTVAGIIVGQSSIGILAGVASGALIALLFWLNERRR